MEFVEPIREVKKIEAMKKVLRGNRRNQLLLIFGINSALRISDLLKLKFGDVTDRQGKVVDRLKIKEGKIQNTKKANKTKVFPLADNLKKALTDYLKDHPGVDPEMPLFYSRKGHMIAITRQQAYRILNEAADLVGIEGNIGTHTLRKTWAYHAYKNGYDISMIQKALMHSSPGVTLRYIGITQEQIDDIYITLNL